MQIPLELHQVAPAQMCVYEKEKEKKEEVGGGEGTIIGNIFWI